MQLNTRFIESTAWFLPLRLKRRTFEIILLCNSCPLFHMTHTLKADQFLQSLFTSVLFKLFFFFCTTACESVVICDNLLSLFSIVLFIPLFPPLLNFCIIFWTDLAAVLRTGTASYSTGLSQTERSPGTKHRELPKINPKSASTSSASPPKSENTHLSPKSAATSRKASPTHEVTDSIMVTSIAMYLPCISNCILLIFSSHLVCLRWTPPVRLRSWTSMCPLFPSQPVEELLNSRFLSLVTGMM